MRYPEAHAALSTLLGRIFTRASHSGHIFEKMVMEKCSQDPCYGFMFQVRRRPVCNVGKGVVVFQLCHLLHGAIVF